MGAIVVDRVTWVDAQARHRRGKPSSDCNEVVRRRRTRQIDAAAVMGERGVPREQHAGREVRIGEVVPWRVTHATYPPGALHQEHSGAEEQIRQRPHKSIDAVRRARLTCLSAHRDRV